LADFPALRRYHQRSGASPRRDVTDGHSDLMARAALAAMPRIFGWRSTWRMSKDFPQKGNCRNRQGCTCGYRDVSFASWINSCAPPSPADMPKSAGLIEAASR
jgi:hypothetical protein